MSCDPCNPPTRITVQNNNTTVEVDITDIDFTELTEQQVTDILNQFDFTDLTPEQCQEIFQCILDNGTEAQFTELLQKFDFTDLTAEQCEAIFQCILDNGTEAQFTELLQKFDFAELTVEQMTAIIEALDFTLLTPEQCQDIFQCILDNGTTEQFTELLQKFDFTDLTEQQVTDILNQFDFTNLTPEQCEAIFQCILDNGTEAQFTELLQKFDFADLTEAQATAILNQIDFTDLTAEQCVDIFQCIIDNGTTVQFAEFMTAVGPLFTVEGDVTATVGDDALGSVEMSYGETIHFVFPAGTTGPTIIDGSVIVDLTQLATVPSSDASNYVQSNAGSDIPVALVDPTMPASPVTGDETKQVYDNGFVWSVYNGTAWINVAVPMPESFTDTNLQTVDLAMQTEDRTHDFGGHSQQWENLDVLEIEATQIFTETTTGQNLEDSNADGLANLGLNADANEARLRAGNTPDDFEAELVLDAKAGGRATVAFEDPDNNKAVQLDEDGIDLQFGATDDLQVNGDPGEDGEVLTSNGPDLPPTWEPLPVAEHPAGELAFCFGPVDAMANPAVDALLSEQALGSFTPHISGDYDLSFFADVAVGSAGIKVGTTAGADDVYSTAVADQAVTDTGSVEAVVALVEGVEYFVTAFAEVDSTVVEGMSGCFAAPGLMSLLDGTSEECCPAGLVEVLPVLASTFPANGELGTIVPPAVNTVVSPSALGATAVTPVKFRMADGQFLDATLSVRRQSTGGGLTFTAGGSFTDAGAGNYNIAFALDCGLEFRWAIHGLGMAGGEPLVINDNPVTEYAQGAGGANIGGSLPYLGNWSNGNNSNPSGLGFDAASTLSFSKIGQNGISSAFVVSLRDVPVLPRQTVCERTEALLNRIDDNQVIDPGTGATSSTENYNVVTPVPLADPAKADPVTGDHVIQVYNDGLVLSTFQGGAWVNTAVMLDESHQPSTEIGNLIIDGDDGEQYALPLRDEYCFIELGAPAAAPGVNALNMTGDLTADDFFDAEIENTSGASVTISAIRLTTGVWSNPTDNTITASFAGSVGTVAIGANPGGDFEILLTPPLVVPGNGSVTGTVYSDTGSPAQPITAAAALAPEEISHLVREYSDGETSKLIEFDDAGDPQVLASIPAGWTSCPPFTDEEISAIVDVVSEIDDLVTTNIECYRNRVGVNQRGFDNGVATNSPLPTVLVFDSDEVGAGLTGDVVIHINDNGSSGLAEVVLEILANGILVATRPVSAIFGGALQVLNFGEFTFEPLLNYELSLTTTAPDLVVFGTEFASQSLITFANPPGVSVPVIVITEPGEDTFRVVTLSDDSQVAYDEQDNIVPIDLVAWMPCPAIGEDEQADIETLIEENPPTCQITAGDPEAIDAATGTLADGTTWSVVNVDPDGPAPSPLVFSAANPGDARWENSSGYVITFSAPVDLAVTPTADPADPDILNPIVWSEAASGQRSRIFHNGTAATYVPGSFDAQLDLTSFSGQVRGVLPQNASPAATDDWGLVTLKGVTQARFQGRDAEAASFAATPLVERTVCEILADLVAGGGAQQAGAITVISS